MSAALIRLEALHKQFPTPAGPVEVLRGIDLEIRAGEFVAIMGPSGSGKSTLMNILGCLDVPSAGSYFLDGRNVSSLTKDELAQLRNAVIGFVFQGFNLLARNSLRDNVALPLVYRGVSESERRVRAQEMLEKVGLANFAASLPSQVSGGQQQRVAIARALINSPKLILADEPTGNLDSKTSDDIMHMITRLNRDEAITVVIVTHDANVAAYAQRLIQIVDGQVKTDAAIADRRSVEALP